LPSSFSGLLEFRLEEVSGAEEHLVGRLALVSTVWHHFIMLLHVKRDPPLDRRKRIKPLLK
jgi:hypothetical protein